MFYQKKKIPGASQQAINERRAFLKKGLAAGAVGLTGFGLITGCNNENGEEEEIGVSPPEDLMREHGVLNRILLIYDNCNKHLLDGTDFPVESLYNSAQLIRNFIEEYHEKLEENHLFPRFEKAGKLVQLVQILRAQHAVGRNLTAQIIELTKNKSLTGNEDADKLASLLESFNYMYRPHEAREDTVLFPALREIVSKNEFDSMGEDFEKLENKLFGEDGFDSIVDKVAGLEKQLGIFELSKFTHAGD
ncbi:MAG TPA: hemerythrin domain-containing protein [Bacteroidales bacterium]|nr:hemerythrin domain-containing protein [Bacteroidales bacterium]